MCYPVWKVCIFNRQILKIRASLCIHAVSPEPWLFTNTVYEYGTRGQPRTHRQGEVQQFCHNFRFSYMFYTFSLPQLKTEKWASLGRLFLPNRHLGWALMELSLLVEASSLSNTCISALLHGRFFLFICTCRWAGDHCTASVCWSLGFYFWRDTNEH